MKRKIGLFSGAFDPIHIGHLLAAQDAIESLDLHQLYFIPAAAEPGTEASEDDRYLMAGMSVTNRLPRCHVSDIAYKMPGPTINIIREMPRCLTFVGDCELYLIIGSDLLPALPTWFEFSELVKLVKFAVVERPGSLPRPDPSQPQPCLYDWLSRWPVGISSTEIKNRVKAGKSIDLLVPPFVKKYIESNKLYLPKTSA